jgi:lipoprotein-anchoring transpeptidase ErfK/SrfK
MRAKAKEEMAKTLAEQKQKEEELRLREQGYIPVANHDHARIYQEVLDTLTPEKAQVRISLGAQRAFLMNGDQIAIETPIATGKSSTPTPQGTFYVSERDLDHRSNLYGDYVDSNGDVVKGNVSVREDERPPGTTYLGASMSYFMRLTNYGIGMHVGCLPGYPASHGCIRLPAETGPIIYEKTKQGTEVRIEN